LYSAPLNCVFRIEGAEGLARLIKDQLDMEMGDDDDIDATAQKT
jgi:hypothetical protein